MEMWCKGSEGETGPAKYSILYTLGKDVSMAQSAAQTAAVTKYIKNNMRQFVLRFHKEREADEIAFLESKDNVTQYIKKLIREDMKKSK